MKKVLATIIVLCCIGFVACKKKTNNAIGYSVKPPKGLDTLVGMSAKVNGQAWQTDSVVAYIAISPIDSGKRNLTVTGVQKSGSGASTVTFTITNYKGVNTYTVDPPYVSATYYLGTFRHFAGSGQINVTSDNEYGIIGSFSFTADTTNLTEGSFNAAQP